MSASRSTAACVTLGAISLSNSSHLPLKLYSNCMKPVTLPPGRAKLSTKPAPTGSGTTAKTCGMVRFAWSAIKLVTPEAKMTSGDERDQFHGHLAGVVNGARIPPKINSNVTAISPAPLLQGPPERRLARSLQFRIVLGLVHQHADAPHLIALLRARAARPRNGKRRRTAKPRDELPPRFVIPGRPKAGPGIRYSRWWLWIPGSLAIARRRRAYTRLWLAPRNDG